MDYSDAIAKDSILAIIRSTSDLRIVSVGRIHGLKREGN